MELPIFPTKWAAGVEELRPPQGQTTSVTVGGLYLVSCTNSADNFHGGSSHSGSSASHPDRVMGGQADLNRDPPLQGLCAKVDAE